MIQARPTVYRGILMRSRLEAAWAEQFDAFAWAWRYEPVAFGGRCGQYLPDFELPGVCLVEVKPQSWFLGDWKTELRRWQAIISENTGSPLLVATVIGDTAGLFYSGAPCCPVDADGRIHLPGLIGYARDGPAPPPVASLRASRFAGIVAPERQAPCRRIDERFLDPATGRSILGARARPAPTSSPPPMESST